MTKYDPIGKHKILTAYREIKEILKGNMPAPRTCEFFISDCCNHNCLGCHSKTLHNTKTPFINTKRMKEILDEISAMGVESVEISGGGEPLLHPNILEIIQYTKQKGMAGGLITNGTCLKDKMIPTLVNDLLFLRIALDAASRETYKKVHGVDHWDKLIRNIQKLVAYKKKIKGKTIIGLKYLIYEENSKEIASAAMKAIQLGVDYIQFKPVRFSEHCIKDPQNVDRQLSEIRELFPEFNIFGSVEKTYMTQRCILNPLHPTIDSSGKVYLCAFFQHRAKSHFIGDISKQTFKEVWYSERHRKAFKENNYKQCNHFDCPFHKANQIAQDGIVKNKLHVEFI